MSESSPALPADIGGLTGPLLLGHFFNWALFGVLTVQAYIYYLAFPRDRWWSKTIVLTAYVLELLQTVLATRDAFRNFGTKWGDMADLDRVGWLWFSVPVMGSIISMLAQAFFSWRIWILSKRWYICVAIMALSLTQGTAGIYAGISSHYVGVFSEVQSRNEAVTSVWLAGTAFCDVIVAINMIYYLNLSRTGFRATNLILTKFVRLTIETGAICATFALLDLIFFLVYKHNNYHLAPSIALSKLYSNSLLVVFNARVRFVGGRSVEVPTDDYTLSAVSLSFNVDFNTGTAPIHRLSRGRNESIISRTSRYADGAEDGSSADNTATKTKHQEHNSEEQDEPVDVLSRQRSYAARNPVPQSPMLP